MTTVQVKTLFRVHTHKLFASVEMLTQFKPLRTVTIILDITDIVTLVFVIPLNVNVVR